MRKFLAKCEKKIIVEERIKVVVLERDERDRDKTDGKEGETLLSFCILYDKGLIRQFELFSEMHVKG